MGEKEKEKKASLAVSVTKCLVCPPSGKSINTGFGKTLAIKTMISYKGSEDPSFCFCFSNPAIPDI